MIVTMINWVWKKPSFWFLPVCYKSYSKVIKNHQVGSLSTKRIAILIFWRNALSLLSLYLSLPGIFTGVDNLHKTGFRLLWLILKIKLPCHTFPAHILVLLSFATWRRIHVGDENRGSAAGLAGTTYILGTNQCTQYPGKRFVTFTISRVKTINVCLQQHLAARQTNESLHTWLGVIRTPLPNEKNHGVNVSGLSKFRHGNQNFQN